MPLIIDTGIPAAKRLKAQGFKVYDHGCLTPDLTLALINLMPNKADTEYDFLQLFAPLECNIAFRFVTMASHKSRHTDSKYINRFYTTFDHVVDQIDGLIVTGAPLDHVAFEDVDYWREITDIFRTVRRLQIPAMYVCWGAFASLYFWNGIRMHEISEKISGVFPHHIPNPSNPIAEGLTEGFLLPHSRYVLWHQEEINRCSDLQIVAEGEVQGPAIVASNLHNEYYITGHGEYATETLNNEYRRDLKKGIAPHIPTNYYPNDDPGLNPINTWRQNGLAIARNWVKSCIINNCNKKLNK